MPFLTARDSHWAQKLLYMGLRSVMTLHSGRCLVSTSSKMGPMLSLFSSVLMVAGSEPAAAIARTCLMSARALTLWQQVHSFYPGCRERGISIVFSLIMLGSEVVLL
jgi:hypothetical protein